MPYDVMQVRKDFPMLKERMSGKRFVYFDTAATAQKPKCMIDAMSLFYAEEYATVHRSLYEHAAVATEKYSGVRRLVADLIHAKQEEEIIFTRGTTEAINLVALSYGRAFIRGGDEILISEMEHHANIVPWQLLAEEVGAKLVVAPINEKGEMIVEEFQKRLSSRTKLVSFCHVSNVFGTINPVKELTQMAHAAGAVVLVDGAQAVPHLAVDVASLGVDFYTFSGHKLYGPTGIGVLYGKKTLLEKMPPYHGGGDMIQEVTFDKTTFQPPPLKFEAGTPMIAEVIGLGAAIRYLNQLDAKGRAQHEQSLLQMATEKLSSIPGVTLYGTSDAKTPIISFTLENSHPLDFGTLISLKGIALRTGTLCAQPAINHFGLSSIIRISFGLYNTHEEIDLFIDALTETTALLSTHS